MMIGLIDELRENFAASVPGFRRIRCMPEDCPAWTVIQDACFGIAIPNPSDRLINEKFSGVRIESHKYLFDNSPSSMIVLLCHLRAMRYEFAAIAAQFAEPGPDYQNRSSIQADPFAWWKNWRELVGNSIAERQAYSTIGEMLVVESLLMEGIHPEWCGPDAGTHDIETQLISVEVKSTIQKYRTELTVSSQNQLESTKPLWLYFVRMEECGCDGESIESTAHRLGDLGYDRDILNAQLERMGFGPGTNGRMRMYHILERRRYHVDEAFPRITAASFRDGFVPKSISHIEYTIDLEGMTYSKW